MKRKLLLRIFMFSFFGVLLIPGLQHVSRLFTEKPLNGAVEICYFPELSFSGWFQDKLQPELTKYFNQRFGFRNTLVRLNNQIDYGLFNIANAKEVLVGKEGYLFEKKYIESYLGIDFIGKETIDNRVAVLKDFQDSLEMRGKTVLVVIAPGKGYFYSEYLPSKYGNAKQKTTNYEYYIKSLADHGVHFIDVNGWFCREKNHSLFPLYPKTGVHWSTYGMCLAADSILHRIENLTGSQLPALNRIQFDFTDSLKGYDRDIEEGMNLLFPIANFPMAYPILKFEELNNPKKKVLIIGDSFFWGIYYSGIMENVFAESEFWYYTEQCYTPGTESPVPVADLDLNSRVLGKDVVLFIVSEGLLQSFPWGFDQKAQSIFHSDEYESKVKAFMEEIKNDPEWLKSIEKKAAEKGISVEEMIRLDAEYMVSSQGS